MDQMRPGTMLLILAGFFSPILIVVGVLIATLFIVWVFSLPFTTGPTPRAAADDEDRDGGDL